MKLKISSNAPPPPSALPGILGQSEALHETETHQGMELAQAQNSYKVNASSAPEPVQTEENLNLSAKKIGTEIYISRIEMRIAGCNKRISQKIIPAVDNPGILCIAQRAFQTHDLVPQMKRCARCYFIKGRGSGWILEKQQNLVAPRASEASETPSCQCPGYYICSASRIPTLISPKTLLGLAASRAPKTRTRILLPVFASTALPHIFPLLANRL